MGLQDRDYMKERYRARESLNPRGANGVRQQPLPVAWSTRLLPWAIMVMLATWAAAAYLYVERSTVEMPPTGIYQIYPGGFTSPVAPKLQLTAHTFNHHNFFVKVSDWNTDRPLMTVFVRDGETAVVKMPAGQYRAKFAEGVGWHGDHALFGLTTKYTEATVPIRFSIGASGSVGSIIYMGGQIDGNLPIAKSSFQ